jgi:Protein of unknown function (DUF3617)
MIGWNRCGPRMGRQAMAGAAALVAALTSLDTWSAELPAPGSWAITRKLDGVPGPGGARKETRCYSAQQLRQDPGALLRVSPAAEEGEQATACQFEDFQMSDGTVRYASRCRMRRGTMRGTWSGTYSAGSFALEGIVKVGLFTLNATLEGRRVGACDGA